MNEKPMPASDRPTMDPLAQLKLEFGDEVHTVTDSDGSERPVFTIGQPHIHRRWLQLTGDEPDEEPDEGGAFERFRRNKL